MPLPVEGAGEGCIRSWDLLLFRTFAGGFIGADRGPGDPGKVDIRIEDIIRGEVVSHSHKLFRGGDGDHVGLFRAGNDTHTEDHRYDTDNCQNLFHRYLL